MMGPYFEPCIRSKLSMKGHLEDYIRKLENPISYTCEKCDEQLESFTLSIKTMKITLQLAFQSTNIEFRDM